MKQVGELNVCGLVYRVFVASGDEIDDHAEDGDGACVYRLGWLLVRASITPSRKRDALVHEIAHGFLEASGLKEFLKSWISPDSDYDAFEEAFIRLFVPSFMRFLDDNAKELERLVRKGKWSR